MREGAGVLVDVRKPLAIADGLNKLLAEPAFAGVTSRLGYRRALDFKIEEVAVGYRDQLAQIGGRTL
jgi:hypothetical protein